MISGRAVGLVAVVLVLFGGWLYLARPAYKYRLTLSVDTPDGTKTASNVFAVHQSKDPPLLPGVGSVGVKGDAVFVDLGGGRNLLAILTHGEKGRYVDGKLLLSRGISFKDVGAFAGQIFPVVDALVPTLNTFRNLADSRAARAVRWDDLEAAFGKGFCLQEGSGGRAQSLLHSIGRLHVDPSSPLEG